MYLPLSTSAAFGVAFGILYKAASTLGRKRKKRGLNLLGEGEEEEEEDARSLSFKFQDFLWHGKVLPVKIIALFGRFNSYGANQTVQGVVCTVKRN